MQSDNQAAKIQLVKSSGRGLPEVIDYFAKFSKTHAEWKKFVNGADRVDLSIIPEEILDTWKQCRDMGVDPINRPETLILSETETLALLQENQSLIKISEPFMDNLYGFLKGSHFVISLYDRNGFLLKVMGDDFDRNRINKDNWVVGALWDERSAGNNAVGSVVRMKKPVQIFGPQHYNRSFHLGMTTSAPIFDPEGEFIGGISLVGCYYLANPHTLGMTVAAAQAIENELKTRKALVKAELANAFQETVISSIPEALITLDNQGAISLINDNAKRLFSLDFKKIEGKPARRIFGKENAPVLDMIENNTHLTDVEVRVFSNNSWGDYTLTCNPILDHNHAPMGRIIILNEIKRVKSMVNTIMGAQAKFRFEDICGKNRRFLMTVDQARMVARSNSTVLLLGRSGTGKDIFAQAIHNASDRRKGPYIAINCGAIPRDLIASELFGHEEGAFTGSRRGGNQGKFELADGGTLFLDEIAETPLELQTALLRVIEDKSVIRIGGTRVRPVDVRIIAATNKDLRVEVSKGNFREDLYYRANVFAIEMVPLNERQDDIPLLLDLFVKKYGKVMGKSIERIDPKIIEAFVEYPWPGNVRELQNTVERMMNYVKSDELTADLIPDDILNFRRKLEDGAGVNSTRDFEKQMITKMIRMNLPKSEIAQRMSISRPTLYRKMKEYNLF